MILGCITLGVSIYTLVHVLNEDKLRRRHHYRLNNDISLTKREYVCVKCGKTIIAEDITSIRYKDIIGCKSDIWYDLDHS